MDKMRPLTAGEKLAKSQCCHYDLFGALNIIRVSAFSHIIGTAGSISTVHLAIMLGPLEESVRESRRTVFITL